MDELPEFTPRVVALPGHLVTLSRQFLRHLEAHGYALNTRISYRRDLEQFVGFATDRDVSHAQVVATGLVEDFVQALTLGAGNSARTAARKVETVKRFFVWAVGRGIVKRNPCDTMQAVRYTVPRVVAPEGAVLMRLIESVGRASPHDVRDYAMLRLMYDAGLRVSALAALDVYDPARPPANSVHPSGRVHYVAKGGRHEIAVCDPDTLTAIDDWLHRRQRFARTASPAALFLTVRGTRFSRQSIWAMVRKHAAAVGLDHMHPHLFRHRRGAELFETLGLRAAQSQLGHASPHTTLVSYGHEAAEKLRGRIRTCPIGVAT